MTIGSRPISIRLFLADGSPSGLTIATIPNWAGSILLCRNASLPDLLARQEAQRPGVYILQGPDLNAPEERQRSRAYIGQAGRIADRLPQSARERDFWEIAAVITTSDPNFSAGHFLALESMMIAEAAAAGRVVLDNSVSPRERAGGLGEADTADAESFLGQVKLILPVLGLSLLRPWPHVGASVHAVTGASVAGAAVTPDFVIRRAKDGLVARAREIDDEFVVLEGSQAIKDAGFASNSYKKLRSRLIDEGAIAAPEQSPFLVFAREVPFSSPSAAAAVVLNRNSNGRLEWKVDGSGETYDDWQSRRSRE